VPFVAKNGFYFKIRSAERGKQTRDGSVEKTYLWPQKAQRAHKGAINSTVFSAGRKHSFDFDA
jgi:hypothetical protein